MNEYIIVSTAVTDDIFQSNLEYVGSYLGGAGIYALAGISLWSNNAKILSGVGSDFFKRNIPWFEANKLSMDGLYEAAPVTPRTNVQYLSDGERIETPCFGSSHYKKMEPSPDQILLHCKNAKGIYIFKDANTAFWNPLLDAKAHEGFVIEWEINADSAKTEYYSTVKSIAEQCDIFSINLHEAFSLLGVDSLDNAIDLFYKWNVPVIFLRTGSSGSVIIRDHKTTYIPSIPNTAVLDPTGAGNASSAAVLFGFCEGYSDYDCGILGSISAAMVIAQYGPPANILNERDRAQILFQQFSTR